MFLVQPLCGCRGDEELRPVCVFAAVGHRKTKRFVSNFEILVLELRAVNGLSARPVAVGEVAALTHEVRNDAVELRSFVSQFLCVVPCAERKKVLGRYGDYVVVKRERYSARGLSADRYVKERFFVFVSHCSVYKVLYR